MNTAQQFTDRLLARLISRLERGEARADSDLATVWQGSSPAAVIGLSGPPGVGKSVIVGALIGLTVADGMRTAVLAVDPSSPFTGGAVLADRMRMQTIGVPLGVFIRSLASRGALGGLAAVVPAAIRALEAAGFDLVIIETVGVGQSETDILGIADTVVVVQSPGTGDEVQALKSGLLEIADIFLLNKVDLPGAEQARAALLDVARLPRRGGWLPPVVSASAVEGTGIKDLWRAIKSHREWLQGQGLLSRRRDARLAAELTAAARAELDRRLADLALVERFRTGVVGREEAVAALFADRDTPATADIKSIRGR